MTTHFSQDLRSLILNYKEPFIITDILKWNILQWDLEQWAEILNDEEMDFRSGKYEYTMTPQWERSTNIFKLQFNEFICLDVKNTKQWLYFDYKYLRECLKNKYELHKSICWRIFGFPEYNSEESTIWIGSEGAHTPCHKDTYGCNLVAQIYGRKRWIMFPPQENLHPTRVPYEESSIYSKLNFFSPNNIGIFDSIKQCKSIVLEAGDVLFVPNGWWHYVENIDTAISVNIWIPLPSDSRNQLKESLTQMLVSQIIKDLGGDEQKEILNPNMEKLHLETQNVNKSIDIINVCKENCVKASQRDPIFNLEELLQKYETNLRKIPDLSREDFMTLLETQAGRFKITAPNKEDRRVTDKIISIIDAFTNEDVINLIAEKVLDIKN